MKAILLAAILLTAGTAEAQWGQPGYSFYTYNSPTWGYAASPYGMTTYTHVGRFTFFQNYGYSPPVFQPQFPIYQPATPIVVPGYGYGGYRQSRHLGF